MKPPFKAEMFHKYYPHLMSAEQAAEQANAIAESWPIIHVRIDDGGIDWGWENIPMSTHRARLAFIEKIEKEPCKHEPMEWKITANMSGITLFKTICKHCRKEIEAELSVEWREKK